jgi:hypothetical protein
MILIRALATSLCIVTVCLCCSFGEFLPPILERDPVPIVGGYSLGRPLGGGLELYEPTDVLAEDAVVEQSVVRIGWDDDFILVEQHPSGDWTGERPQTDLRWHIIVVSTGKHYSWRSYDDFVFLRDRVLRVPDTIEMRDAREVYGQ